MKIVSLIIGTCVVAGGGFFVLNSYIYNEKQGDVRIEVPEEIVEEQQENIPTEEVTEAEEDQKLPPVTSTPISPVTVTPISHATAILEWGDSVIYADPVGGAKAFEGKPAPSVILVTDIHGDHLSTSTLALFAKSNVLFIVPQAVKDLLPVSLTNHARVLKNGEEMTDKGLTIRAVPMYNDPQASDSRHPKGRGNGYVVSKDNYRVYIAGDTSGTSEMRALTAIDMAFIPMNFPYTMSVEGAVEAVLAFKPKLVYPYHYRGPEGLADVAKFKSLVQAGNSVIKVILLNWYPG